MIISLIDFVMIHFTLRVVFTRRNRCFARAGQFLNISPQLLLWQVFIPDWTIMALPYAVDASPLRSFAPLRNEPPASFTQDLLPGKHADVLLLGCGDPRNILFTVFYDEGKGTLLFTGYPNEQDSLVRIRTTLLVVISNLQLSVRTLNNGAYISAKRLFLYPPAG
jgi:Domain of unknown function (DUF4470)